MLEHGMGRVDGDWGMGGLGVRRRLGSSHVRTWEGARGNRKTKFFPVVISIGVTIVGVMTVVLIWS